MVALEDKESVIRRAAFKGVVAKGFQARAVPALITMLGVETSDVRQEIVRVLGEAGERRAVEPLADRLGRDEDKRVRQASAIALARLKDKKAVPALVEALNDPDRSVETYSMRALRLITDENKGDVAGWKD